MYMATRIGAAVLLAGAAYNAHAAATYPPSCFAAGLPLGQSANDPHAQSLPLTLHGDFNACFISPAAPSYAQAQAECVYSETVAISIWRVACSGGKSATLFEIDRPGNMQGNTNLYPTFPGVWVKQGPNIVFIRLAQDANTTVSQVFVNSPVYRNSIYTLENSPGIAAFDYNLAFLLTVDNNTGRALQFDLDTYNPADYPAATQGLPITGYLTGAWYDPTHGGEGMLTEVLDNADGTTRTLFAAWYTFDASGLPFWLTAQGTLNIGDTQAQNVAVQYLSGGGFAGNFTPPLTRAAWGTMSFSFPDCNTLSFSYSGATDAQTNGPAGSGSRTWKRLGNIGNLGCQ